MEDLDPPREQRGAARAILDCLNGFGLESDEPILWQHERIAAYDEALRQLVHAGRAYVCACSRAQLARVAAGEVGTAAVYPGTCRARGLADAPGRSLRLLVPPGRFIFDDRACGRFTQDVEREVGDFVIRRADGLFAYQLAVVVDDAAQRITDVVRGADLIDNTPRQMVLQGALGHRTPRYLHVPVVLGRDGAKLSKQNGAAALDASRPLQELESAGRHLGMPALGADSPAAFLRAATHWWRERWVHAPTMAVEEKRTADG